MQHMSALINSNIKWKLDLDLRITKNKSGFIKAQTYFEVGLGIPVPLNTQLQSQHWTIIANTRLFDWTEISHPPLIFRDNVIGPTMLSITHEYTKK